jgi:hypothetical protein
VSASHTTHRPIQPHSPKHESPDKPNKDRHGEIRSELWNTLIDRNKIGAKTKEIRDDPSDTHDQQVAHHEKVLKKLAFLL